MNHNLKTNSLYRISVRLLTNMDWITILETAKLLIKRQDIIFLFVGEGPQKKENYRHG